MGNSRVLQVGMWDRSRAVVCSTGGASIQEIRRSASVTFLHYRNKWKGVTILDHIFVKRLVVVDNHAKFSVLLRDEQDWISCWDWDSTMKSFFKFSSMYSFGVPELGAGFLVATTLHLWSRQV